MYLTGIGDRNYFNMSVSRYGNLLGKSYDSHRYAYDEHRHNHGLSRHRL